jgi:hypothetical protein
VRDTASAVMSGIGKATGQRMKQSTTVRQYSNPAEDGTGLTRSMCICTKQAGGRGKLPNGDGVARNLEALAGLASSSPIAAVFLNAWPHEALGDEFSCCLNSGDGVSVQGSVIL